MLRFPRCAVWIEELRIGEASHPGRDEGFMLRLRRGQNRFNAVSDDVEPTVLDEQEGSDTRSLMLWSSI